MDKENIEWPEEGKLLAQVGNSNLFTVPAGYFEGLEERIVAAVKIDELRNTISAQDFTVPDGYFDDLSSNIQSRIAVQEMLEIQHNAFEVPANYFENLSNNIQSRIVVEEALGRDAGFEVPGDYFEDLSIKIQSRVFVEEALSGTNAFSVPENYFEQLNTKIVNKTVRQDVLKRKGTLIKMMRSTAFKYATAACFVLVAGASFLLWPSATRVSAHDASYLHKELSNVPVDELRGYIQLSMDGSDVQHTVGVEDLPVKEASFKDELQDYVDEQ